MTTKTGLRQSSLVFSTSPSLSGKVEFEGSSYMDMNNATSSSGTATLDMNSSNQWKITLTENITTFNVSNENEGQSLLIRFLQDGTGSRTIAWPADFKWPGGVTPVLSTAANAADVLQATFVNGAWYGNLLKGFA
jgi:hypothetical protein